MAATKEVRFMSDTQDPNTPRGKRRWPAVAGLVAAGVVAGGVLAGTLSATAATSSTTTPSPSASSSTTQPGYGGPRGGGPHGAMGGSSPVRSDEKALSSADAEKVKAAALKAVPGGTVYRVETDAGDGVYEAHMTKSDGTAVTVKLDKDFNVTAVEDGMGKGDPAPAGAPNHGQAPPRSGTGSA
jgi:hypothetical protein